MLNSTNIRLYTYLLAALVWAMPMFTRSGLSDFAVEGIIESTSVSPLGRLQSKVQFQFGTMGQSNKWWLLVYDPRQPNMHKTNVAKHVEIAFDGTNQYHAAYMTTNASPLRNPKLFKAAVYSDSKQYVTVTTNPMISSGQFRERILWYAFHSSYYISNSSTTVPLIMPGHERERLTHNIRFTTNELGTGVQCRLDLFYVSPIEYYSHKRRKYELLTITNNVPIANEFVLNCSLVDAGTLLCTNFTARSYDYFRVSETSARIALRNISTGVITNVFRPAFNDLSPSIPTNSHIIDARLGARLQVYYMTSNKADLAGLHDVSRLPELLEAQNTRLRNAGNKQVQPLGPSPKARHVIVTSLFLISTVVACWIIVRIVKAKN